MLRQSDPKKILKYIGIMFLPAIPAYIWAWPNLTGSRLEIFQIIAYLYILGGTIWITIKYSSLERVGLNFRGLPISIICSTFILGGRQLIISSVYWEPNLEQVNLWKILGDVLFYFGLVGLSEELLFRGLLYTSLEEWRGSKWAVWGSSFGFLLWHIFGQGVLIGVTTLVIGLGFALFRLRLGGIVGLIILHALWDLQSVLQIGESNMDYLTQLPISKPGWLRLGTILMVLPFLYLWLLHPRIVRR